MPVLPLVGSSSIRPGASSPDASAASTIDLATRSFVEPVGFCPSSFAYRRTPSGAMRESSTRGVPPTRSSREFAGLDPTGHGGEENDGRGILDGRLEIMEDAYVLAVHVDV